MGALASPKSGYFRIQQGFNHKIETTASYVLVVIVIQDQPSIQVDSSHVQVVFQQLLPLGLRPVGVGAVAKKSALLMFRVMKPLLFARFIIGIIGIATVFFALFMPNIVMLSFMSLLAGELMERALFFRAVAVPKMPGGVQS